MMRYDEQGVYFLTAKGKAFYAQLMEQGSTSRCLPPRTKSRSPCAGKSKTLAVRSWMRFLRKTSICSPSIPVIPAVRYAPYGYVLHPTIRNKLAVDPEAADVIRRIFREALEGSNTSQIARSLNDDGIPTPGQYFSLNTLRIAVNSLSPRVLSTPSLTAMK